MKKHEWHENLSNGEKIYYQASIFGGIWEIKSKSSNEENWTEYDPIPDDIYKKLRDILYNKYQRNRVPWEHIKKIDKILYPDS